MHPFAKALEDVYRYKSVRITTEDGEQLTGTVIQIDYNKRDIILKTSDHRFITTTQATKIELLEDTGPPTETVKLPVKAISPHPYAAREFEYTANSEYITEIHDRQIVKCHPSIFKTADGTIHVVDGHKALWALKQAGVEKHHFELLDISEWEAARRFCFEHLPTPTQLKSDTLQNHSGTYSDLDCVSVIANLYADWGDQITDIPPVEYAIDRLGVSLREDLTIWDLDRSLPAERAAIEMALGALPRSRLEGETVVFAHDQLKIELTYSGTGAAQIEITAPSFDDAPADADADSSAPTEQSASPQERLEADLQQAVTTLTDLITDSRFGFTSKPSDLDLPSETPPEAALYEASVALPSN